MACIDFFRLPPATLSLVLLTVFGLTKGHALPRQTTTLEYHELHVIAWPPIPTEAPLSPFELLRRQQDNTVCGYIGDLQATCSAGSHCVLDTDHNVMGCCPNAGACTAGVYTNCIDYNSGAQTEANPYVYTCQGPDVCYKNEFGDGVYQYGCGTASGLATTVQTTLSGVDALVVPSTSVGLTETPTSLSEPTTINPGTAIPSSSITSQTASSTTGSSLMSSTSTSPSQSSSTSPTSSSPSSTSSQPSPTSTDTTPSTGLAGTTNSSTSTPTAAAISTTFDQTGAIVGGTISGVAILVALVAIAVFCVKKRQNQRLGPGPTPGAPPSTEYSSPMRSHGAAFAPLPTWHEEDEPPTPQPRYNQAYAQPGQAVSIYHPHEALHGDSAYFAGGPMAAEPWSQYPNAVAGDGGDMAATPIADTHMRSGTNELDDFSHGYSAAVGQIQHDEDRRPLTMSNTDDSISGSDSGSPGRLGDRPLWQQNRRQSRNLTWM